MEKIKRGNRELYQPIKTPLLPNKKFNIIYADPPWQYSNKLVKGYGAAEHHYSTLSIKELCEIPIKDITENNAMLFLWVTSPFLEESFEVIKAWGFKYKTSFVWDKMSHNFGYYNSVRHEFLLVCRKGKYIKPFKLFPSVIQIKKSKRHSEKPEYFIKMIAEIYPSGRTNWHPELTKKLLKAANKLNMDKKELKEYIEKLRGGFIMKF